ncbi:iron-sulfur cluster repair di-iron protein [Cytophagaceae bacterium 50C-KIRBA]|uniref:Iron-sulfur cluster repair di-iron protein n=1 Tax=Aquirufa beregesia TaxID=2516556 RepID=A0ABX0EZB1_9BACT|nr:iron-sulfur cluster repair di-iron protein [Aquirufa beregesia]NGZ44937.1 iron-sulfur cluster repair di-iron protein [Aquirufa beregesia]
MPTIKEYTLVVPDLEPRVKHSTIFAHFDQMGEGESFLIQNDHDPKPLYYQLLAERGNQFSFDYIENGPHNWLIRIQKNAQSTYKLTLGELVNQDFRLASFFSKLGLDFCCGGKKTLKQACAEKPLDYLDVLFQLEAFKGSTQPSKVPYQDWSLDFLVDYIVNTHHSYVRNYLPDIQLFAAKVMRVHGDNHPELIQVHQLVEEIADELNPHMMKEEQVLFPFIKALALAQKTQEKLAPIHFGTVRNPIHMMEMEHEQVGQNFESIRQLTQNYRLPEDACGTYTVLFQMLQAFEEDLHMHIHLENNVLFPQSLELEKRLSE